MSKWEDIDLQFIIFWPNKNINFHGYLWIYKAQTECNSAIFSSYQVKKIILLWLARIQSVVQTDVFLDSSIISQNLSFKRIELFWHC